MDFNISNKINYYSKGEGKPLYLIHGFPDCAENFSDQIEFFSQNGFKVIAPFLPGYHEDDETLDTYQTLRVAEVLIEFIESISGDEKKSSILEANQIQTAASAGESLAAGIIFTMPALIIIGVWNEFDKVLTILWEYHLINTRRIHHQT